MGESWNDLKARLAGSVRTIDRETLREALKEPGSTFDFRPPDLYPQPHLELKRHYPFFFEDLLSDVSALVDRCMAYRRELNELEILWVKTQLDLEVGKKLRELEATLDGAESSRLSSEALALLEQASTAFLQGSGTGGLGAGFGLQSSASAKTYAAAMQAEEPRRRALTERRSLLEKHQDDYELRYNEEGNAHNYSERIIKIRRLFDEDFTEATDKATAVAGGLEEVLGLEHPLLLEDDSRWPKPSTLLDRLLYWTRQAIRLVNVYTGSESEFDVTISLRKADPGGFDPLHIPGSFANILEATPDKPTHFAVLGKYFAGYQNVRLLGVSMLFIPVHSDDEKQRMHRAQVRVTCHLWTPDLARPPIVLGTVPSVPSAHAPSVGTGLEVHNANPIGRWRIGMVPSQLIVPGKMEHDGFNFVEDLLLQMRVAGRRKPTQPPPPAA